MKFLYLILFFGIFLSCGSEESPSLTNIDGSYAGQFYVAVPDADFVSSEVTLIFDNGRFTGTSSKEKYPAMCRGTYEIVGDEIKFTDECVWTTEFDPSIILNGNFKYVVRDGQLVGLNKKIGDNSYVYTLSKGI